MGNPGQESLSRTPLWIERLRLEKPYSPMPLKVAWGGNPPIIIL